jgi:hypothetical protein
MRILLTPAISAPSPTNNTAMSLRMTRAFPGLCSGYDRMNPFPATLKSKPRCRSRSPVVGTARRGVRPWHQPGTLLDPATCIPTR